MVLVSTLYYMVFRLFKPHQLTCFVGCPPVQRMRFFLVPSLWWLGETCPITTTYFYKVLLPAPTTNPSIGTQSLGLKLGGRLP